MRRKQLKKYGEQYEQILMAQLAIDPSKSPVFEDLIKSVEEYNDTVAKSKNPFTDDDVKAAYDKVSGIEATNSGLMIVGICFHQSPIRFFDNSNIENISLFPSYNQENLTKKFLK